jgi:hypothetical protein
MTLKKYFKTHNRGHNKPPIIVGVAERRFVPQPRSFWGCVREGFTARILQQIPSAKRTALGERTPGAVPCTRAFKPVPIQRKSG